MSYNPENLYKKHRRLSLKNQQSLRNTYHRNQESLDFYKVALVAESSFVQGYKVGNEQASKVFTHKDFKKTVETLCEKYPLIAIDNQVLGEPRLTGTRFAVSNVLTALTLHNNFEEVLDEYDDRYTKEQFNEAIKFARDFLDSFYTS